MINLFDLKSEEGEKMVVTLKLKCGLERYSSNSMVRYEIDTKKKISDVLEEMHFPVDRAGIILIDGVKSNINNTVRGGETVKVFPPTFNCSYDLNM